MFYILFVVMVTQIYTLSIVTNLKCMHKKAGQNVVKDAAIKVTYYENATDSLYRVNI